MVPDIATQPRRTPAVARAARLQSIVVATVLLVALAARLIPGPRTVDDAYITFRYARNLVEGQGFVYNPGERVLGTTTPLYTLLMAGLSLLTGSRDFPILALLVNALAGTVSVALLYALARRLSGHWMPAVAVALLWAVAPYSVTFAVGGMETDLSIALLLACGLAYVTGRSRYFAVLAGVAYLARPDTVILTGLLYLGLLAARLREQRHMPLVRRVPWREALLTLCVVAPWLAFGTFYFGSPIPASIGAKSVTYRLPPEADLVRLIQHFATPFFESRALPPAGVFGAFGLYVALCAVAGLRLFHSNRRTWPLIAYPLVYSTVFAIANPLLFRWYLSPPLPFYFLLIITGVWTLSGAIVDRLAKRLSRPHIRLPVSSALLALFVLPAVALTLNAWDLHPDHGPDRPAPEMAWFKLELLYAQAAEQVLSSAAPGDTLCAGDIGVLGYRTGLHILDTVGLVTPASTRYYPADPSIYVINYAIPADLVLALDPDYIVILEVYGRRGLLPDPRFQARYGVLDLLETDIYGSDSMLILHAR